MQDNVIPLIGYIDKICKILILGWNRLIERRENSMRSVMLKKVLLAVLVVGFVSFCVSPVLAAIPNKINYQGILKENGNLVTATKTMRFKIYDVSSGGTAVWDSGDKNVSVNNGLFNQVLDFDTTSIDWTTSKYLEITVGGTTLSPREEMVSTSTALDASINHLDAGDGSPTDAVYVADDGKVGVGTTSPNEKMTLEGVISLVETTAPSLTSGYGKIYVKSTDSKLYFKDDGGAEYDLTSGGGGGGDKIEEGNTSAEVIDTGTDGRLVVTTEGTERMRINSSGNVGIWTTNPAYRLDVYGAINSTDVYKINGNTVLRIADTNNTFVGRDAGASLTTGNNNTFFGRSAGTANTTGYNNVFIGSLTGDSNTTGNRNVFVGDYAGQAMSTGESNTFVGDYAGYSDVSSYWNTFVGARAGYYTTGSNNTFLGYSAGESNTTAGYNTFVGNQSGYANTTGRYNTFVGYGAGDANTTGEDNAFFGRGAGTSNTIASYNTFIGSYNGIFNTTGGGNTFVGYQAGRNNTTGGGNTIIGKDAGRNQTTASSNTFVGNIAGFGTTTGHNNTSVGYGAGYYGGTGYYNTFLGSHTGYSNTIGTSNTFVGRSAGNRNTEASYNTFVGEYAGYYTTTGGNNTALGYYAGYNTTTGTGNVFLGRQAGYNETGSNKLYIDNSNTSSPLIYGEFDNDIVTINGKLGVGTTSPARALHISDVLRLEPRASAPSSPSEGDIYVNSSDHHIYCYLNGSWAQLD